MGTGHEKDLKEQFGGQKVFGCGELDREGMSSEWGRVVDLTHSQRQRVSRSYCRIQSAVAIFNDPFANSEYRRPDSEAFVLQVHI